MVETAAKKQKKGTISEDDVCTLLQRYPAATILSLLREVAQYPELNIDWDLLLKRTSTGIRSARELQLLWHHLAYRHPLIEVPDTALPLDDDSDLEYEVEAFPPVATEGATEAASCVKVLAAAVATESVMPNNVNVEGDMLNGHASKFASENPPAASLWPSSNVSHIASVQSEGVDANGLLSNSRKKRKWSDEEDLKLVAGVQKWGEGNWATIVKEGQWGRTPSQLSQRWAHMRKKQGSGNVGAATATGQLSVAQLDTRRALNLAIVGVAPPGIGSAGTNNPAKLKASNGESPDKMNKVPAQRQISQPTNTTSLKAPPTSTLPKLRPPIKKAPPKPPSISCIERTAVAAGARVVKGSDADGYLVGNNIHFIRTGSGGTAASLGGGQAKDNTIKPSPSAVVAPQYPKARTMPSVGSSGPANDRRQKQEERVSAETNAPSSETKQTAKVQESNLPRSLSKAAPGGSRSTHIGATIGLSKQAAPVGNSQCATVKDDTVNDGKDETSKQVVVNHVPRDASENSPAIQGSCTPTPCADARRESSSLIADRSTKKINGSSEGLAAVK